MVERYKNVYSRVVCKVLEDAPAATTPTEHAARLALSNSVNCISKELHGNRIMVKGPDNTLLEAVFYNVDDYNPKGEDAILAEDFTHNWPAYFVFAVAAMHEVLEFLSNPETLNELRIRYQDYQGTSDALVFMFASRMLQIFLSRCTIQDQVIPTNLTFIDLTIALLPMRRFISFEGRWKPMRARRAGAKYA